MAGLYYYRFRDYSPDLGRFCQTDPLGYVDGLNLYAYVNNNPLNWLDPWGLGKDDPWYKTLWDWIKNIGGPAADPANSATTAEVAAEAAKSLNNKHKQNAMMNEHLKDFGVEEEPSHYVYKGSGQFEIKPTPQLPPILVDPNNPVPPKSADPNNSETDPNASDSPKECPLQ